MKRVFVLIFLSLLLICNCACNQNQSEYKCPDCEKVIDKTVKFCPNCGYSLEENSTMDTSLNNDAEKIEPESKTNFELICDAIKENNNHFVIGTLMGGNVYLSTENDKIIVKASLGQSTRPGANPHEKNYTSVDFKVSIDKDGLGEGSCVLTYEETRVVDHMAKVTARKRSTAIFDVKITNVGDKIEYRDYKIYYDNQQSYTKDLSGGISYNDSYLLLCKVQCAESILELALESFYSIVNE